VAGQARETPKAAGQGFALAGYGEYDEYSRQPEPADREMALGKVLSHRKTQWNRMEPSQNSTSLKARERGRMIRLRSRQENYKIAAASEWSGILSAGAVRTWKLSQKFGVRSPVFFLLRHPSPSALMRIQQNGGR
jgi:hypothetical protein